MSSCRRVGAAVANLDTVDMIFTDLMRRLHVLGAAREEIRGEELLRMRRLMTLASKLCVETADSLSGMMGITGFATVNPVQRFYRDCRTVSMHVELNWDHTMSATGKARLGVPTGDPLIDTTAASTDSAAVLGTQL